MQHIDVFNQFSAAGLKSLRTRAVIFGTAVILAACGGGGGVEAPRTAASNIKVFGDSIADSGVFGFKFTVNPAAGAVSQIWTERIAAQYGKEICPFFRASGPATFGAPVSTCSSFEIGRAHV